MTNESLKREEFIRRKKNAHSEADTIAQQLTNIYRQLSVLGEDASELFNKQLLGQANPDVLASLKSIPGGEEVRDYYNFLTNAGTDESDSSYGKSQEDIIDGMLPKAEQISPVWETFGIACVPGTSANVQKSIQTPVVNPVPTPSIPSFPSIPQHLSLNPAPQQNKIDFSSLLKNIEDACEKQKSKITQTLNFIVIDSDIETMHQNLKVAADSVAESLDRLKNDLVKIVNNADGKTTVPGTFTSEKSEQKSALEPETEKNTTEKNYRNRTGQKFSVDMTDNED